MEAKKELRTKTVLLRFTESEFKRVNSIKTIDQLAVWIRELALNPTVDLVGNEPTKTDPELMKQLRGISSNLNQATRLANIANQGGDISVADFDKLTSAIEGCTSLIEEIRNDR